MVAPTVASRMDQTIREYIQACNDGDIARIAACLHADAVHYYPNSPKFIGASTIATHFAKRVKDDGVSWTVDQIIVDPDHFIAVLEFTRFDGKGRIIRGLELYEFEAKSFQILELRPYFASPVQIELPRQEHQDFDYAGRGYPTTPSA
jgi:SnoaL-like domain